MATGAGVAALLRASEPAFLALKLVGAGYLVFLGLQALIGAVRGCGSRFGAGEDTKARTLAPLTAFTSLLPQFSGSFTGLLALGLLFCTLTLAWLTAYAAAVARAGDLLRRTRIRRAFSGVTGAVLVALGFRLAREHRS